MSAQSLSTVRCVSSVRSQALEFVRPVDLHHSQLTTGAHMGAFAAPPPLPSPPPPPLPPPPLPPTALCSFLTPLNISMGNFSDTTAGPSVNYLSHTECSWAIQPTSKERIHLVRCVPNPRNRYCALRRLQTA